MQFQVQKLVPKVDVRNENDQLDLFAGVHTPLDDPYNIFFRISDVENHSPQIYFYAYSLGKRKVVFWGIYDYDQNEFLVDSACRYNVNLLSQMISTWKTNAYQYYSHSVKDRASQRMLLNLHFDDVRKAETLLSTFKVYFLVKLLRQGKISPEKLGKNRTELMEELFEFSDRIFEVEYQTILDQIKREVYTRDVDKSFIPLFEALLTELEFSSDENLIRGVIEEGLSEQKLEASPFALTVFKYMMVNYFISMFAGIEEYRIAKFIVFSEEHSKEKGRFESVIKESFFYNWLLEMSRIFDSEDSRSFIVRYSMVFVEHAESRLNMEHVGVIGGPPVKNKSIREVAIFFTKFIELSKYSKLSVINNLEECPIPEDCDMNGDEICGLYDHGTKRTSKFDLT